MNKMALSVFALGTLYACNQSNSKNISTISSITSSDASTCDNHGGALQQLYNDKLTPFLYQDKVICRDNLDLSKAETSSNGTLFPLKSNPNHLVAFFSKSTPLLWVSFPGTVTSCLEFSPIDLPASDSTRVIVNRVPLLTVNAKFSHNIFISEWKHNLGSQILSKNSAICMQAGDPQLSGRYFQKFACNFFGPEQIFQLDDVLQDGISYHLNLTRSELAEAAASKPGQPKTDFDRLKEVADNNPEACL